MHPETSDNLSKAFDFILVPNFAPSSPYIIYQVFMPDFCVSPKLTFGDFEHIITITQKVTKLPADKQRLITNGTLTGLTLYFCMDGRNVRRLFVHIPHRLGKRAVLRGAILVNTNCKLRKMFYMGTCFEKLPVKKEWQKVSQFKSIFLDLFFFIYSILLRIPLQLIRTASRLGELLQQKHS